MAAGSFSGRDFRIGDWLVQPRLATICRRDEAVHVTPRAMKVLVFLAEANGRVVSRNEILDAVWPRMAVTQDALTQCLVELRKAFRDDARQPTIIATIPKLGVRLIAPVTIDDGPSVPRSAATRVVVLAFAVGIALAGAALWLVESRDIGRPDSADRSIAVLPFSNDSALDEDVEFFVNGLYDELLSRLANVSAFEKVISRTSAMSYRDSGKSRQEIARELGVTTILEGHAQRMGDAVRVGIQLVDADTDRLLWEESFTKTLTAEDYFAIQRDITISIASALGATLSPDELERVQGVQTISTRAYDLYLSANDYLNRTDRRKALPLAARQYTRAAQEDPEFALAWARLALTHTAIYWLGFDHSPARLSMAESALDRAFELAPELPEAHLVMANYQYRGLGHYEEAVAEFAVAERSLPQNSVLHFLRSGVYRRLGRWDLAVQDGERAVELDPRNALYLEQLQVTYSFLRNYARADQILDRILDISPDTAAAFLEKMYLGLFGSGDTGLAHQYSDAPALDFADGEGYTYVLWLAAIFDRDYEKALAILDDSSEESTRDMELGAIPRSSLYARTYTLEGRHDEARFHFQRVVEEIEKRVAGDSETDPIAIAVSHLILAEALAGLNEVQPALRSLQRGLDSLPKSRDALVGSSLQLAGVTQVLLPIGASDQALKELDEYLDEPGRWAVEGLRADPRLDSISGDARFWALVQKYGRN